MSVKPFELHMGENRVVRGDYWPSEHGRAQATVIICHGYKGFKDWGMFPHLAASLAERCDVVSMNFSHNGVGEQLLEFTELEKFAKATYTRDLEDLDAVVGLVKSGNLANELRLANVSSAAFVHGEDAWKEAGVGQPPVLLLGHSRGGAVCLIYALDHPRHVAGAFSWNGITDVDLLSDENKREMRAEGRSYTPNLRTKQMMPLDVDILEDMELHRARFDIQARIAEARLPIYLIQGTEDGEKRLGGSAELTKRNPAVHWTLIPGGDHTFGAVHPFRGETEPLGRAIAETKRGIEEIVAAIS